MEIKNESEKTGQSTQEKDNNTPTQPPTGQDGFSDKAKNKTSQTKDSAKQKFDDAGGLDRIKSKGKDTLGDIKEVFVPDENTTGFKRYTSSVSNLWKSGVLGKACIITVCVLLIFLMTRIRQNKQADAAHDNLVDIPENMVRAQSLSADSSIQSEYQFAVNYLKKLFSSKGYDTAAYRLVRANALYISPAQEMNGLQTAYEFGITFAVNGKGLKEWIDLDSLLDSDYDWTAFSTERSEEGLTTVEVQITKWNGKYQFNISREYVFDREWKVSDDGMRIRIYTKGD